MDYSTKCFSSKAKAQCLTKNNEANLAKEGKKLAQKIMRRTPTHLISIQLLFWKIITRRVRVLRALILCKSALIFWASACMTSFNSISLIMFNVTVMKDWYTKLWSKKIKVLNDITSQCRIFRIFTWNQS